MNPRMKKVITGIAISTTLLTSTLMPGAVSSNEKGKVADFGDIWKVTIRNNNVRFNYRVNLQPAKLVVVNRAR